MDGGSGSGRWITADSRSRSWGHSGQAGGSPPASSEHSNRQGSGSPSEHSNEQDSGSPSEHSYEQDSGSPSEHSPEKKASGSRPR